MTLQDQLFNLGRKLCQRRDAIFAQQQAGDIQVVLALESQRKLVGAFGVACMEQSLAGYPLEIPQRAASRQQEFGYISEDDNQYHATRRIDWDYLLG